ncbi:MAG TPA: anthranilate phosphoribosyltransferase [Thiolinea sp.]|nr:anthranilate phosphoribosyltransferase [Thiolinea sp.]
MDFQGYVRLVSDGSHLSRDQMRAAMELLMTGEATPAQIGAFLMALRMRGETVDEITASAEVMRALSSRVRLPTEHLVDTCGTGGDVSGTFNISTASTFVAAAAGVRVAKHGNRSASSKSGSADVLEVAGVNLDISPEQVISCIEKLGVGFMFAPRYHSAMRHAIGPRRELGIQTIFNLLGPLTNPAGAPNQVLGVFSRHWVRPLAEVLQKLGSAHVMVLHSEDGLDEISIAAPTHIAELHQGSIREYTLQPEDFGMERMPLDSLRVKDAGESLALIRSVLDNQPGPARDIVTLNAGAAIYVGGRAASLQEGTKRARAVMADGRAARCLEQLVTLTQGFQA